MQDILYAPPPKVVLTHKSKVFISLEISNVWKKRDSPIDSINSHSWCHNYRKESHITFLLLLNQSHPRAPSQLTRRHRWQRKTVGLVTEHAVGKSHEDYQCLGPGRRKWRFLCSLCWSSPGSPRLCQVHSRACLSCPDQQGLRICNDFTLSQK